jgi:hypothetical protein
MKDRDIILLGILLWLLWPKKKPETSVTFPNEEVLKTCPGNWIVPYDQPCPPTA